ncbi:MAG: chaperone modulator CbpM [Gammaproteobacteria bacterium]|nr:chaperone modulator CbpM [Gammaproteobacteria bacterium]
MPKKDPLSPVLEEGPELSLAELCRACQLPPERAYDLVEEGLIEPLGREPTEWRFTSISVRRVHRAERLQRDLGVNLAGAALVLDLLDELEQLRIRLRRLDKPLIPE